MATTAPSSAQTAAELDAGRFEIRVQNRRVGVESFRVWREGGEVKAVGLVTLDGSGSTPMDVRLQTDEGFRPTRYGLRAPQSAVTSVDGAWTGDRLRLHITSSDGERWKEFLTPGQVAVLEDGVAHHALLLLQLLPADPVGARLTVIVPSRGVQSLAVVRSVRPEPIRIGDATIETRVYEVEVSGSTLLIWVDDDGRVVQVAAPDQNRIATRLPDAR